MYISEPITRLRISKELVRMQLNSLSPVYRIAPVTQPRNAPHPEQEVARAKKPAEADKKTAPAEYIVEGEVLNRKAAGAAYAEHGNKAEKGNDSLNNRNFHHSAASLRAINEYQSNTLLGSGHDQGRSVCVDCYV